jgi:putative aldouronate transport system substrate-binding protein
MKRSVAALMVLLIPLTACTPVSPSPPDPFTVSVLYNDVETAPFQKDWRILEEYRKRWNITLDVHLGDDKAYDVAIQQTFASGDIPDVILKCWPDAMAGYANSGLLLPISDYVDEMPYFQKYIQSHGLKAEIERLKDSNGEYHILPGYQREIQTQQWIYRSDAFTANRQKAPTTYDELFDSLVVLKKAYPDSTPITASWGGAHLLAMMGAGYGIPAGWAGTSAYDSGTDLWSYAPAMEAYRELYRFLNRCYAADLLDPAVFTQTNAEFLEKLVDGKALVTVTWVSSGFGTWNEQLRQNGITDGTWAALPVPESTIGIRALPAVDRFKKGLALSAKVVDKPYFKSLLAFLDWAVYSDEGMDLNTWGIENLTYGDTSSGKTLLAEVKSPKNPLGTLDISKEFGINLLFNLGENESFEDYKRPADIVSFLDRSWNAKETAKLNPQLKLGSDDIEVVRILMEALTPYVDEAGKRFITGESNLEEDWSAYLREIEDRGYKTVETVWNGAWEKQRASK